MPFSLRLILIIELCMRTSAQFLVNFVPQFVVNSYWLFDLHQWFVHYYTLNMGRDAVLCLVFGYIVWTVIYIYAHCCCLWKLQLLNSLKQRKKNKNEAETQSCKAFCTSWRSLIVIRNWQCETTIQSSNIKGNSTKNTFIV